MPDFRGRDGWRLLFGFVHVGRHGGRFGRLLDALGIDSAQLVGQSLGGMIAQTIAIEHPSRVRSLTSISSNTAIQGRPGRSQCSRQPRQARGRSRGLHRVDGQGMRLPLRRPGSRSTNQPSERPPRLLTTAATTSVPFPPRHFVLAYGDRTSKLRQLRVPTLVIHGAADPSIEGGRATAAAIPGSKLVIFDGMGTTCRCELWCAVANHIADLVRTAS
ncbi:alpha/beta fold hydrolase [Kibdelosporangium philippinense]|uniref:alpha/beta fold hydrolase n=1 Tax=Kibdelosporangium philippinense TaxID=211113 RepID=UPI003612136D